MSDTIEIVERGCGWPKEGGMYFSIGMSSDGIPPEEFLLDPLMSIPSDVVIKNRGLTLMEVDGIWHVVDHVGSAQYPNAADHFEELSRFGFHQRIETTLDFSKLDLAKSRYFVAHSRVIPDGSANLLRVYNAASKLDVPEMCPKRIVDHDMGWAFPSKQHILYSCANLLWTDLIKGDVVKEDIVEELDFVLRTMPSFKYNGLSLHFKVNWQPGFFASFPISMMRTLIYKGSMGEHEESAARAIENGWTGEIEYVEL